MINMEEVYEQLDKIYDEYQGQGVEEFLLSNAETALNEMDTPALVQLLNELIGYYREHSEYEKCISYCVRLQNIVEQSELKGSMAHATTLLNIATCLRSAGLLKEANAMYQDVKSYYDANLSPDSMLYASLFNNMSLLFQEMGDFESAVDCLERALGISQLYPECRIEQATTYANLATTLIKLDRKTEAEDALVKSISLFEEDEDPDYHYSAALSAMAELKYSMGDYRASVDFYEASLRQIEMKVGRSRAYEITLQNLNAARSKITVVQGLLVSEDYYNEIGKKMIQEKFPEYENRIAVGLVGEGSECFGFDDEISPDHDFGPGFCMWLTDEDYDRIGLALQAEYDKLPAEHKGFVRIESGKASKRTGAFRISDFYKGILGIAGAPASESDWLFIEDARFATAVNGRIFRDDLGQFSSIRNEILKYYPEGVYRRKLARCAALMSQYGQYNYYRMLKRQDRVAAGVALYRFIEQTMEMVYMLNGVYAPFYKWKRRGLEGLPVLPEIKDQLDFIASLNVEDRRIEAVIEDICTKVLAEMVQQELAKPGDNYLDNHTSEILSYKPEPQYEPVKEDVSEREIEKEDKEDASEREIDEEADLAEMDEEAQEEAIEEDNQEEMPEEKSCMIRSHRDVPEYEPDYENKDLVEAIIKLEWEAFDKVNNQGGRAYCQDDYNTFSIMRRSQYMLWPRTMLKSFISDFVEANKLGWNIITEKYGRMEESTAPEEYEKIKDNLPEVTDEKRALVDAIVEIQVSMMEEFAKEYPKAAGEARSIHTSEDNFNNTSYETYLRGELLTYSDDTLKMYGQFVVEKAQNGENIARLTMENSAKMYGYESIDKLEEKL